MNALLNKRGDSMFLRLNIRETKLLCSLAKGGAAGIDARTLKRLQELGLVSLDLERNPSGPVTRDGLDWIRNNPTASGR